MSDCKTALNDSWVLWHHSAESRDWSINGYEKIIEISTISDFWLTFNKIRDFRILEKLN